MNQGGYPGMYQPIQPQYIQQAQPQHQILIQQQLQQSQQVPILNQGIPGYQQAQILNPQFNDDSKKKKTLVGKMEELKNVPNEKQMYVFGMDIPQTGITNLNQEGLYEKGWKYNHNMLTWIKEIEEVGKNLYKFSFFNFKEWKTLKADNIEMNLQEDLVTLADFEKSMTVEQNKQI
ncbi:hypothetical protein ABPG72_021224 [Tetrahymena utriculariae]